MTVEIFTDGGCRANGTENARAAWAVVLKTGSATKEIRGLLPEGIQTNNRAELYAIIKGLKALKPKKLKTQQQIHVYSDSQYALNVTDGTWTSKFNLDLVRDARALAEKFRFDPYGNKRLWFHWVRGHAGHPEQERADQLAGELLR